jgi:hypothetical protein
MRLLFGSEVRELSCYEIALTVVATRLESCAERSLTLTTHIRRTGIKIVYSMIKGILTQPIDLLLINLLLWRIALVLGRLNRKHRHAGPRSD